MEQKYVASAKIYPTENLGKMSLLDMLSYFVEKGAMRVSDLHIKVGVPPTYRIDGNLIKHQIQHHFQHGFPIVRFLKIAGGLERVKRFVLVLGTFVESGDENDGDLGSLFLPDFPDQVKTVELRQHGLKDDEGRVFLHKFFKSRQPIRRPYHFEIVGRKQALQSRDAFFIVIDDEDLFFRHDVMLQILEDASFLVNPAKIHTGKDR